MTGADPGGAPLDPTTGRALRGDLDVICLRALHPDPARRYDSAAALAADLERHLAGQPIDARRDSVAYVAGRFVRRHRPTVAAALVALAALVGGLGAALASLDRERAARTEAETAATRANEAAELLASLFNAADPSKAGGRDVSARDLLADGLVRVAALEDDALRGYLLHVLGDTYWQIGETALADSLMTESVAAYEAGGVGGLELAETQIGLADKRVRLGDPAAALGLFTQGYEVVREHVDEEPMEVVRALTGRAFALRAMGRIDEARRDADFAVETVRETGGEPLARALYELGFTRAFADDPEGALEAYQASLALYESLHGPDYYGTLYAVSAVAEGLRALGRYEESEPYLQRSLAYNVRVYGDDHIYTAEDLIGLAEVASHRRRFREAKALLDSAITILRNGYPEGHETTVEARIRLARVHNESGTFAAAEAVANEALDSTARLAAGYGTLKARARGEAGVALVGQGRYAEARPALRAALDSLDVAGDAARAADLDRLRAALVRADRSRRS